MEDYKCSALIPLAHQQPACVQTSIHIYIKLCLIKNLKITMWKDTKPKKKPHKNVFADSSKRNQQHGCAVTGPRLVVQQLYIARHGRQEIDF